MSEDANKVEKTKPEPKTAELSDHELGKVAGGWSGSDGDERQQK
jgi:hypothetical protein